MLGAGLTTPPAARPEVSAARTEPRPTRVCPAAYVIRCACDPAPDGTGGETVVDHIRLFPRRPDVRWTYRVHEQILPSLRRAKIPVRWTDVTVRNTGYVDKALRAKKLDRDTRILKREFEERPGDPRPTIRRPTHSVWETRAQQGKNEVPLSKASIERSTR